MKTIRNKRENIFSTLLLLTFFFILLEISFFIQCTNVYFADFTFVSEHLAIPVSIIPEVLFFIFAQLLIHIGYCLGIYLVILSLSDLWRLNDGKKFYLAIGIWSFGIFTILFANLYQFPNSSFSELMSVFVTNFQIIKLVLVASLFFWSLLLVLAVINYLLKIKRNILLGIVFLLAITSFTLNRLNQKPNNSYISSTQPNIIIIGMDSLRPDFLGFFGHAQPTPFLDALLAQSIVFSDAVTPLARTFPSWSSILTGQYPLQTGVRFNLANQSHIDFSHSLPAILRTKGYQTIYATDETRFSNVDKNLGFDQIISPPIGLNDFLLGTFNDFPLSNLLINTPIGKWLFPYSYGNRPVVATYDPDSFLNLLRPVVSTQYKKPVFLAVHFCLTHFPYHWGNLRINDMNVQQRYQASVKRIDQQVGDFFTLLNKYHYLDHAVVVILSDHGEALELNGDRITEKDLYRGSGPNANLPKFYPPGLDNEAVNQSGGHGTDVLGLPQYHSLLAFKLYGMPASQAKVVSGVVSLLDIKPTILSLLQLPVTQSSGASLISLLTDEKANVPLAHIFLESDYSPEAIRTVYPETRKVILEGIELFQIDPKSTRLVVKDSMGDMIIRSKQYADIYGDWMLALYPQDAANKMPILINLVSGEWTNDLHSDFALQSPAHKMLAKLKAFYGKEINNI